MHRCSTWFFTFSLLVICGCGDATPVKLPETATDPSPINNVAATKESQSSVASQNPTPKFESLNTLNPTVEPQDEKNRVVESINRAPEQLMISAPKKLSPLQTQAVATMKKAATYYREKVATHGGYVYHYALDLSRRWGEGVATPDQIWVQPPGTPTVGMAYLDAYSATGDTFYLNAARDAAVALVYGQMKSGGWTNCIDFDPKGTRVALYRNGKGHGRNVSSLDDGQTGTAILFLIKADQALEFKHEAIHESVQVALDALLKAQFPNGAFPQVWDEDTVPDPPVKQANYPDYDWRTEGRIKNYWDMYTLNDNVAGSVADALLLAHQVYGEEKYKTALENLGQFLIQAQMPEPQSGWAQQYNYDMQPIWARKFEPPGVSGDETQEAIETLMTIFALTGDTKYLDPIPNALAYLKRSLLPEGKLARYYELKSNKPLYMVRRGKKYELTYDDSKLPAHYGWKTVSKIEQLEKKYEILKAGGLIPKPKIEEVDTRKILSSLTPQGRWISTYNGERLVGQAKMPVGEKYLSSEVFSSNLSQLSEFVRTPASTKSPQKKTNTKKLPAPSSTSRSKKTKKSVSSGTEVTLVRNGKPMAIIVTNGNPKESQITAAAELQEHIRIMSGATLPIIKENELRPNPSKALILIGPGKLTQRLGVVAKTMEPETFVVKTMPNVLILAGEDGGSKRNARNGTLWAVYDFLQDQLGCRWIWPGETGQRIPRRKTIEVPSLNIRETPTVKIRFIRLLAQDKHRVGYEKEGIGRLLDLGKTYDKISEDERVWSRRMRLGRSFKLSYGHAFTDWWEKYNKTNREIFALQPDGQRRPRSKSKPDFVKMCVSNPKLWDMQLAHLKKYAQQGARGLWVNACENDGSGGFCVCKRCRSWDADPNTALTSLPSVEDGSDIDGKPQHSNLPESLSDRYARWYNELAIRARKIDPESKIIAYGYSKYRSPPTSLKHIEPNVWIGYVGFNAYPRPDDYKKMSTDEWFGWSKLGATVFLRSNSLFYLGEGAPYVTSQQVAEDLQFQVQNGLQATDFDALQGYWAATGPTYYVLARMLWDTEADVEQVLAEFYDSFGPFQDVAKEYYEYWEKFTVGLGNNKNFINLKRPDRMRAYSSIYNEAVFRKAESILNKAKPLAKLATEEERDRFENIVFGLQHGRLLAAALKDGKTSTGLAGKRLMAFRRKIASRNVLNVYWVISKEMRYRVFN
ncbi:Pectic acid lyase [Gimesia alba]|uniref:Pectic acid lyase n=2 Tax=Gimesia alba TaxID=2527973 RepID=A0A517RBE3_9PLAN|nr:Pectic acid lyase [Gimesia alba]